MGRWEPNPRGRLTEAAMALYAEQGYDNTTVAEIAERAGLTERTFFRHFTDKREVLFVGAVELKDLFVQAVAAAPPSARAMDAVGAALDAAAVSFQDQRPRVERRQAIIRANPELQERELIKLATLAEAVGAALRRRGVPDLVADLTAQAGMAVFRTGFERWAESSDGTPLADVLHATMADLRIAVS